MLHNIKYQQWLVTHERHRVIKKGFTVTWEEIAYFIDNSMTKQERKKNAVVWNASLTDSSGGGFMLVEDITPFDAHNDPDMDYSMDVNTDNCWFQKLPNSN